MLASDESYLGCSCGVVISVAAPSSCQVEDALYAGTYVSVVVAPIGEYAC
jgi:hypothetical protein